MSHTKTGEPMESGVNDVMRNKNRVLKHLGLIRQKTATMKRLGFSEQSPYWPQNQRMLADAKCGNSDINDVVEAIGRQTGLSIKSIRNELLQAYATGLLEFHATDVCDLNCVECHYREKDNATFPFDRIEEYFTALNPRCVTITGGGEPNCYSSHGKTLNELVHFLHDELPQMQLGLINNNTQIPSGDWYNFLSWQRTSLDAPDAQTYAAIKRKEKYDSCIKNIYTLLKSDIPFVGIGFLYRNENIAGMKDFLLDWYLRWLDMSEHEREKFNIQFRPISPAIDKIAGYNTGSDLERSTAEMFGLIKEYSHEHADFHSFLKNTTNFYAITPNGGSYYLHDAKPFRKCYNALVHRVLRSDGNEYPDFLLCNDSDMSLGNALTADNSEDERIRIALGTFYFYHRMAEQYCDPKTCRQCWVSSLVEAHLDSDVSTLDLPDSCFF